MPPADPALQPIPQIAPLLPRPSAAPDPERILEEAAGLLGPFRGVIRRRVTEYEWDEDEAAGEDLASGVRRRIAEGLERAEDLHAHASESLASEVFRGVLEGTWVITDHFESDLRRFIIAERCRQGDGRALSQRESQVLGMALQGHSNKYVALELGLTPSTVATHLRRAMSKLGVGSRQALIQALSPAAGQG